MMPDHRHPPQRKRSQAPPNDQPLIGSSTPEGNHTAMLFVTDQRTAAAERAQRRIQAALSVIGAFADLDYDEAMDALDRIRHESTPTPPIDLDL